MTHYLHQDTSFLHQITFLKPSYGQSHLYFEDTTDNNKYTKNKYANSTKR